VRQPENGVRKQSPLFLKRPTASLGEPLVEALCAAADGSFVSDEQGSILLWNGAAEALLGYPASDVLGRRCCTLLCHDDGNDRMTTSPACASRRERNGVSGTPSFDVRTRTKAGLSVWLNVSVLSIADPRTGAPLVVHLFRDVTFAKEQLALAHESLAVAVPDNGVKTLTRREREVLQLMGDGLNTTAMARRLNVSRATVRNHVQNILPKLEVHSRLEAVAHGRRHRLI
jgi:PAS domain S-box-containing protein